MEAFPAADEEQFDFIKSVIDRSDYYLLILAGRYGSLASDGVSYTEKEYRYAIEKGVPVLVMLHDDRGSLPFDKTEATEAGRSRLEAFIKEVSTGRIRRGWKTADGLKLSVREALDHAKATKPRVGWVRGDSAAGPEIMTRLLEAIEENKALKEQLELATPAPTAFQPAGLETSITLCGIIAGGQSWRKETTFQEIFKRIAPKFIEPYTASKIRSMIAEHLGYREGILSDQSLYDIRLQFEALGLVKVSPFGATTSWELTQKGKQEILALRVVREQSEVSN